MKNITKEQREMWSQVINSFPHFLTLVWRHLNLPDPTPTQIEIAEFLQHGGNRICIHAFRGIGKSWITSAYVLWMLLRDPQLRFLIISASAPRANNFSRFTLRLIKEMPILKHLFPKSDQRQSYEQFDVAPARADHAPSVKSVGVFGQMEGSRADIIIADDIEIASNSYTTEQREKLLGRTAEFDSILKPGGSIKVLGTPQSFESIYDRFSEKGFLPRYWTAEYPKKEDIDAYRGLLAPAILERIEKGIKKAGEAVDKERFTTEVLEEKKLSMGKSNYMLQFMLNTSLSDADKFPLKTSHCTILPLGIDKAPSTFQWSCFKNCQ